jgi:hypothetical protein
MPLTLQDLSSYASIAILVILVLVYFNYIKFPKEGMESNPVAGAAVGNAANRQFIRSDGYGSDASGISQVGQEVVDDSTRAAVAMGLVTLPSKQSFVSSQLGFQTMMNEPPVFWNQGNLDEVVEYENSERINMPSASDLMANNLTQSAQQQKLMSNLYKDVVESVKTPNGLQQANKQQNASLQGFRVASAY